MFTEINKVFLSADYASPNLAPSESESTDVIVHMKNGDKYAASFFSYEYLENWKLSQKDSEENLNGKYFWFPNMIVADDLTKENILFIVQHLIDEGDFTQVFKKMI